MWLLVSPGVNLCYTISRQRGFCDMGGGIQIYCLPVLGIEYGSYWRRCCCWLQGRVLFLWETVLIVYMWCGSLVAGLCPVVVSLCMYFVTHIVLHWTLIQARRGIGRLGVREESGIRCVRVNVSVSVSQKFLLCGGVWYDYLFLYRRFIFTDPYGVWRMWLHWFKISQNVTHSFLMIDYVHLWPVTFALRDWR